LGRQRNKHSIYNDLKMIRVDCYPLTSLILIDHATACTLKYTTVHTEIHYLLLSCT